MIGTREGVIRHREGKVQEVTVRRRVEWDEKEGKSRGDE